MTLGDPTGAFLKGHFSPLGFPQSSMKGTQRPQRTDAGCPGNARLIALQKTSTYIRGRRSWVAYAKNLHVYLKQSSLLPKHQSRTLTLTFDAIPIAASELQITHSFW